jgi:hypothetical protein
MAKPETFVWPERQKIAAIDSREASASALNGMRRARARPCSRKATSGMGFSCGNQLPAMNAMAISRRNAVPPSNP